MTIYQLTEEDVERSSTLEPTDIGKWCFLVCGCHQGFFDSRDELESFLAVEAP